jgi:hypothetical protein
LWYQEATFSSSLALEDDRRFHVIALPELPLRPNFARWIIENFK